MVVVNGSVEEPENNGLLNDELLDEDIADDESEDISSVEGGSGQEVGEEGENEAESAAVSGDAEYELSREEPFSPSANEWKIILMKAEFAEDLLEQIRKMKPYERCRRTGRVIITKSLASLVQGFCLFLNCGTKVLPKVMRNLTKDVFARCDLLFEICRVLPDQLLRFQSEGSSTWFNVFNFLKSIPDPRTSIVPRVFNVTQHPLRCHKKKKLIRLFQDAWIGLMMCTVPQNVLSTMIPYITDNVLDKLDEPHKTADFFFKAFDMGDIYAVLSLGAIFKLIVSHNFEYPNFYDHVYLLTKPSVLYLDQKEKFISLLDTFLSSTHIPSYIVAGFAKRLARMLLLAPVDAQEPVLGLIRNLLIRHPNVSSLIHREVPETLLADPYDESEATLNKSGAMNSSLWEIKSLQKHWHQNVAKRAKFVDKKLQQMESFVRYRSHDELFSQMMAKPFGTKEINNFENYRRSQDGSEDEEDEQPLRKLPKRGKFTRKHKDHNEGTIPVNFSVPNGSVFPKNSFNFICEKFWTV